MLLHTTKMLKKSYIKNRNMYNMIDGGH